jgi:hypothetical protein
LAEETMSNRLNRAARAGREPLQGALVTIGSIPERPLYALPHLAAAR